MRRRLANCLNQYQVRVKWSISEYLLIILRSGWVWWVCPILEWRVRLLILELNVFKNTTDACHSMNQSHEWAFSQYGDSKESDEPWMKRIVTCQYGGGDWPVATVFILTHNICRNSDREQVWYFVRDWIHCIWCVAQKSIGCPLTRHAIRLECCYRIDKLKLNASHSFGSWLRNEVPLGMSRWNRQSHTCTHSV